MAADRKPPGPVVPQRIRLDRLLVERGLMETRQKAQALVMAGRVLVDGKKIEKAGALVKPDCAVEVSGPPSRYVGRGGLKLEAALERVSWDVQGLVLLDVGASTGGFVDCLLQRGAARVHAVDVGSGQMDWRLRQDPRVHLLEGVNARYLLWDQIGEAVDGITVDVSFISATTILPQLRQFARSGTRLLVLVKPQFEVGKGQVGKGGIVRDPEKRRETVGKVRRCMEGLDFADFQEIPSPILGVAGNQEFFLFAVFKGRNGRDNAASSPGTEQLI
ncbi:MAG: TlyA family RNA methyltransferase [Acidobacteria bacterium]|nr:TlyA family RNA methyltransferase [Acidobacteriota bacterium]